MTTRERHWREGAVAETGSVAITQRCRHRPRALRLGLPMLLVHGGTADRTHWLPLVPPLAERFSVDAMDRRGRGLSTDEIGPYSIEREAEHVVGVVKAAGSGGNVIAHTDGAVCALGAAFVTSAWSSDAPELMHSQGVIATPCRVPRMVSSSRVFVEDDR